MIPKEFEQIDASNIDPRKYVKFLYLVDRTANIESLEEGLITRFSKRYPRERKLRVLAFQNKDLCDLDPEFAVEDVFNESNDELRVLVDNKFKSITYTPEPAISTPINFSQAETIRGGVYSTVDITDDKTTPKNPNNRLYHRQYLWRHHLNPDLIVKYPKRKISIFPKTKDHQWYA